MIKYQTTCNETEIINEKLKQTERELTDIRKEANNYQNMLQQSQTQYATLERKYSKVKKMLREFQQRDRDMVRIHQLESLKVSWIFLFLDPIPGILSATSTGERHRVQRAGEEAERSCDLNGAGTSVTLDFSAIR